MLMAKGCDFLERVCGIYQASQDREVNQQSEKITPSFTPCREPSFGTEKQKR